MLEIEAVSIAFMPRVNSIEPIITAFAVSFVISLSIMLSFNISAKIPANVIYAHTFAQFLTLPETALHMISVVLYVLKEITGLNLTALNETAHIIEQIN